MAKKAYSVPVLILSSGGIDITDSQEGSIGGGEIHNDFNSYLLGGGLEQSMLEWAYSTLGTDPAYWSVDGFNYADSNTWDIIIDYIANNYPYY